MPAQPDPDLRAATPTEPPCGGPRDGLHLPEEAAASSGSKRMTEYDREGQIGAELVEDGLRSSIRDGNRPSEGETLPDGKGQQEKRWRAVPPGA